jgi:DNA-directed RNA polymerase subunit M
MATMFCPKCGSLLKPKTEKKKKVLACSCGYTAKDGGTAEIKEKVAREEKKVSVVSEDENVLPETDVKCPECGNDVAYYWTQQMRAGDEPETKFLKCKKCKHVWRDSN